MEKSPGGLPFLSIPRRFAWGSVSVAATMPLPRFVGCINRSDDCLAALVDMDVFNSYPLMSRLAFQFSHGVELLIEQAHQASGSEYVCVRAVEGLILKSSPPQEKYSSIVNPDHLHSQKRLNRVRGIDLSNRRNGCGQALRLVFKYISALHRVGLTDYLESNLGVLEAGGAAENRVELCRALGFIALSRTRYCDPLYRFCDGLAAVRRCCVLRSPGS
ncbi:MAG: hypothetical protein ACR2I2_08230 [Bryobacteraceae bacterium]